MVESGEQPDGRDEKIDASLPDAKTFASGRYVVRRLLGEGAQKTVYLVHDQDLDRDCALALVRIDLLNPDDLNRVRREAQVMAGLGAQPHIVTVFDLGDDDGKPYIVSEYVPAGDLRQELREAAGPLPLHRSVALAKDLCRALSVAHEQGIVHRDLKPGNVWLTKQGAAKLGDFGIAQAVDRSRLTMTGAVTGTAAYMAPEQAQGKEVTARSDLYALGCLLYELLTGRPPFVADDPMAVVAQHVYGQPSLPSKDNPAIPEELERLVLRLLAKEPEARPASAEEVLAELERIEAALPETASLRPVRGLARLWARPAYRVAAVVLLLTAIGGGVAGGVLMGGGGDTGDITYQELRYHYEWQDTLPVVPIGDCQTEDLVESFTAIGTPTAGDTEGQYTGDFVTELELTTKTVLFSADDCRSGFFTLTSILRDSEFNELHITDAAPLSLTLNPDGESYSLTGTIVETVTGGTGIYKGASGGGTCTRFIIGGGPGTDPQTRTGQGDCVLQVTTESAARLRVPLGAGVGASPNEVAIFGSPLDLPTTVEVLVAYSNGGTEALTGLSLRLVPPEGTQILTAARTGDEQTATEGERVWALPNLPPVSDVQTFQFTLQFLSVERRSVSLAVEINGDGFDEPVTTVPVTINVVQ